MINKIRNSLRISFWDGFFAACMTGLTTEYLTPYALALKANIAQVGTLTAVPNLVASLTQLKAADITDKAGSRKKVITSFILLHALMGIPIILVPYVFKGMEVAALIICVTLFTSFNALAAPVWLSLMSDHLPADKRGRYFGWRNKVLGTVSICCLFLAGIILQIFKNNVLTGFLIIFIAAFICRIISWSFLKQMYEPPVHNIRQSYFSFIDFVRKARESNFAKFTFFAALFSFSVNIAAPFFSVFMLRDLKFDYITYTILITTVSIATILTIHRWGTIADRAGNLKILRLTSFFIATLPLWWLLNRQPVYLFFIQALGGFVWAGYNLCVINFIYDAVSPAKRTRCFAYFNAINGLAICSGAFTGGHLVAHLPALWGYKLLALFVLASLLRFLVAAIMLPLIKEVRPVEKFSSRDVFYSAIGLKPITE